MEVLKPVSFPSIHMEGKSKLLQQLPQTRTQSSNSTFVTTSKQFWKNRENHRNFFDWSMIQLGYKCMDDRYNVTKLDIVQNGGAGLLRTYYGNSPSLALQNIYPKHNWEMERFKNKPQKLW